MPWTTTLKVAYHQQNRVKQCGAASAMMIVDALHGGLVQEEVWWPQIQSSLSGWDTDPKSLEKGLNSKAPTTFEAVTFTNEPDGTRPVVEALCSANASPAAALVYRKSHWIVVCNVNLSAKPGTAAPSAVLGFYVNDPSLTPLAPPQPHAKSDKCGTAMKFGSAGANQYLSYQTWKSGYFNGYVNGAATAFTTVCAKKRTPIANLVFPSVAAAPSMAAVPSVPEVPAVGGKQKSEAYTFVRPTIAQSDALSAIKEHGLAEQEPLQDAVRDVTAGEPELVHRLDDAESYYYLIPLVRAKDVVGIARTDARQRDFMGVCAVPARDYRVRTADEVARELPPGFHVIETVWLPCQESTSPYSPFYRAVGPDGERFVDRDGTVFRSLTPLDSGD